MSGNGVDSDLTERLARSVLRQNLNVRKGEHVMIEGWNHTLPWAVSFAREARRLGAQPMLLYEDESAFWDSVEAGEDKVLGAAPAHEFAALGKTDAYVHMWGPGDRIRLNQLPEKRRDAVVGWNDPWYEAAGKAGVRGVRLELGRIYPAQVTAYGVPEETWQEQVIEGTMVSPGELTGTARPIVAALRKGRSVRIHDDDGTDLTLGLAQREPVVLAGRPDPGNKKRPFNSLVTLPSGLVRVALDEKVADGTIAANRTSYYDDGKATGARLSFRDGKLVDASFDAGGERFEEPFAKATKGKDQPGILSIGLNPKLHDTPQVEDVEQGAILVAVGGNRHLGGKNPSNFFGWAINAGATLEVDGKPIVSP